MQLAEEDCAGLRNRYVALEADYSAVREGMRVLERQLECQIPASETALPPETHEVEHPLEVRTVLCVGGRTDVVRHFKGLVQLCGGGVNAS